MRIGELARHAGLRTSAIRYYESVGLMPTPARVSGRREYRGDAVDRLRLIAALQGADFRLGEIRRLLSLMSAGDRASGRWREAAHSKLEELDARIARLKATRRTLAAAIDCACAGRADDCDLVAAASARGKARRGRPRQREG